MENEKNSRQEDFNQDDDADLASDTLESVPGTDAETSDGDLEFEDESDEDMDA